MVPAFEQIILGLAFYFATVLIMLPIIGILWYFGTWIFRVRLTRLS